MTRWQQGLLRSTPRLDSNRSGIKPGDASPAPTMFLVYAPAVPFTLVHPVAVLLLARGPLSLLALVSGAVAPDLPYYLRVTPLRVTADSWYEPYVNATTSHSLGQLVPVALPLALTIYLCGCLLLPPLRSVAGIESLGVSASDRSGTFRRGAWIVVSLVIGVLTHLVWDALTERGGSESRLLQHGSTALGFLVLVLVAFRRRMVIRWHDVTVRRSLLATVVPCALVALAGALVASWSWLDPASGLSTREVVEGVLTNAGKGAGAGVVAAALVLALVWWVIQSARSARSASRRVE